MGAQGESHGNAAEAQPVDVMGENWFAHRRAAEMHRETDVLADMSGNEVRERDRVVHLAMVEPRCLDMLLSQQPLTAKPPHAPRKTKPRPRRAPAPLSANPVCLPPTPPQYSSRRPQPAFRTRRLKAKENEAPSRSMNCSKARGSEAWLNTRSKAQRSEAWLDTHLCHHARIPKHLVRPRSKSAPVLRRTDASP